MGKGNRAKQARAQSVLAAGGNKRNNKKTLPTWAGTAIVAGILAIAILSAVLGALGANGVFVRGKQIASTANYEITVPMMSYLVYTTYQDWVSNYESTGYMQYIKGEGGDSLNKNIGLRDQYYSVVTDKTTGLTTRTTWFDYFATSAGSSAQQILIFCECARAAGITLDEEDNKKIDQAIQMIELYAQIYGYTTTGYVSMQYGKGVSVKDIRAMMELSELSAKYAEQRQKELEDGATKTRVDDFYAANKKDYDISINYVGIEFSTSFKPVADTEADAATKNEEAYKKYQEEQAKYLARTEALKACTDATAFSNLLLTYFEEDAIAEGKTAEEAKAIAVQKQSEANYINYEKPSSPSDMDTWLFSETARVEKDTNSFKSEKEGFNKETEKYSAVTSTYSACIVTQALHRNDTKVRDVGHILLKTDTYKNLTDASKLTGDKKTLAENILKSGAKISAEEMSKALLKKMVDEKAITMKKGENDEVISYEITKEKFEEYAKKFNEDSNVFYEEVQKGDMVKEFENWLFDSTRQENEISNPAAIKTTYGYHIMMYLGEGEETWFVEAQDDLIEDDYDKWYEEMKKTYAITTNQKNWNYIDG